MIHIPTHLTWLDMTHGLSMEDKLKHAMQTMICCLEYWFSYYRLLSLSMFKVSLFWSFLSFLSFHTFFLSFLSFHTFFLSYFSFFIILSFIFFPIFLSFLFLFFFLLKISAVFLRNYWVRCIWDLKCHCSRCLVCNTILYFSVWAPKGLCFGVQTWDGWCLLLKSYAFGMIFYF